MSIVKISSLTKRYDRNIAVDNLNLEVQEGEIFGLLDQMEQERAQQLT